MVRICCAVRGKCTWYAKCEEATAQDSVHRQFVPPAPWLWQFRNFMSGHSLVLPSSSVYVVQPITPDDDARKQESYSEPSPTIYLIDRWSPRSPRALPHGFAHGGRERAINIEGRGTCKWRGGFADCVRGSGTTRCGRWLLRPEVLLLSFFCSVLVYIVTLVLYALYVPEVCTVPFVGLALVCSFLLVVPCAAALFDPIPSPPPEEVPG